MKSNTQQDPSKTPLRCEHYGPASLLDLLLGRLRHQLCLDDHRLPLRQHPLAQDLEVPELANVDHGGGAGLDLVLDRFGYE